MQMIKLTMTLYFFRAAFQFGKLLQLRYYYNYIYQDDQILTAATTHSKLEKENDMDSR